MQVHAMFEDPRPSGDRMYIWSEGFKRDNLQYIINSGMNHNVARTNISSWGYPSGGYTDHRYDGVMLLGGEVVHCLHVSSSNNNQGNTLDFKHMLSMDPANPVRNHRVLNSGNDTSVLSIYNRFEANNANPGTVWEVYYNPASAQLDQAAISQSSSAAYRQMWALNLKTDNNALVCLTHWSDCVTRAWPGQWGPGRIRNFFGTSGFTVEGPTQYGNVMLQFIGTATNGHALFLNNSMDNDFTHLFIRYDHVNNVNTVIQTVNTTPSAGGSSLGGNRGTAFGNTNPKVSSMTFPEPGSAVNWAFWTPYFDLAGNYVPMYYQWNRSSDAFIRNTNITVNWTGTNVPWNTSTQTSIWLADNVSAASSGQTYAFQRPWYNETFVMGANSSTRYLTLMQFHGSGNAYDAEPRLRTFVTFSMSTSTMTTINYHSRTIIPYTPKNVIWLNDAHTQMGVFGTNQFNIYTFNESTSTGWGLTATLPHRFDAVGRDTQGRIWAVEPGPFTYGRLHIITPAVPTTVSVALSETSYNYAGTNIDTTATVNAYDSSGNRIAASIVLNAEGTSLKFINTLSQEVSTITTVTNTASNTLVDVRIVSAGTSFIRTTVTI